MKRKFVVSLIAIAVVMGFSGCASNKDQQADQSAKAEPAKKAEKPKDNRSKEQKLSVGMTKDEVRAAIGNPRGTAVNSDGAETWTYNDAEKHFIPYYALSGGKTHFLMVVFDKDGKVKSWSSSEQGMY